MFNQNSREKVDPAKVLLMEVSKKYFDQSESPIFRQADKYQMVINSNPKMCFQVVFQDRSQSINQYNCYVCMLFVIYFSPCFVFLTLNLNLNNCL